jgi:hypothetical protein
MEYIERNSPEFNKMKFNNYDNHVANVKRNVYENFEVHNVFNTIQKDKKTSPNT